MGNLNQLEWIRRNIHFSKAPVLEVGSRHYAAASDIDYRSLFKGVEYLGVDMSPGKNVDRVLDFTSDYEVIRSALGQEFGTVVCCSVMEHVNNIFKFAQNLSRIVKPGGALFVSAPFAWRFHGYPNDFWRFTPAGLKYLFPDFDFPLEGSNICSNVANDDASLKEDPNPFTVQTQTPPGTGGLSAQRRSFKYLLAPAMINLVGIKRAQAACAPPAPPI